MAEWRRIGPRHFPDFRRVPARSASILQAGHGKARWPNNRGGDWRAVSPSVANTNPGPIGDRNAKNEPSGNRLVGGSPAQQPDVSTADQARHPFQPGRAERLPRLRIPRTGVRSQQYETNPLLIWATFLTRNPAEPGRETKPMMLLPSVESVSPNEPRPNPTSCFLERICVEKARRTRSAPDRFKGCSGRPMARPEGPITSPVTLPPMAVRSNPKGETSASSVGLARRGPPELDLTSRFPRTNPGPMRQPVYCEEITPNRPGAPEAHWAPSKGALGGPMSRLGRLGPHSLHAPHRAARLLPFADRCRVKVRSRGPGGARSRSRLRPRGRCRRRCGPSAPGRSPGPGKGHNRCHRSWL
ncbi:hypothetical protein BH23PLA1_BH23PLA1_16490 [soil metagenome]